MEKLKDKFILIIYIIVFSILNIIFIMQITNAQISDHNDPEFEIFRNFLDSYDQDKVYDYLTDYANKLHKGEFFVFNIVKGELELHNIKTTQELFIYSNGVIYTIEILSPSDFNNHQNKTEIMLKGVVVETDFENNRCYKVVTFNLNQSLTDFSKHASKMNINKKSIIAYYGDNFITIKKLSELSNSLSYHNNYPGMSCIACDLKLTGIYCEKPSDPSGDNIVILKSLK